MALTFAQSGAEAVIITYNSDENKAIEVCKKIETHGSKSMAIHLEASNLDSIKKMVSNVENEFSKIDVLVNNAGINRQAKMDEVKEEDWDDIMAVNLKGPFFCSREVFPIMKKMAVEESLILVLYQVFMVDQLPRIMQHQKQDFIQ